MPVSTTLANDPPSSPKLTLINNFGYSISSSSNNNNNNNNNHDGRKIYDSSGGEDFKKVSSCGKVGSRRRIVVDLAWRRGKVGDKDHEYQRFF